MAERPDANNTFKVNPALEAIVVLNDEAAQQDWGWKASFTTLSKAIKAFASDVDKYPDRIKALELF